MLINNFSYSGFGVGNAIQAENKINLYNWKRFLFCFVLDKEHDS